MTYGLIRHPQLIETLTNPCGRLGRGHDRDGEEGQLRGVLAQVLPCDRHSLLREAIARSPVGHEDRPVPHETRKLLSGASSLAGK